MAKKIEIKLSNLLEMAYVDFECPIGGSQVSTLEEFFCKKSVSKIIKQISTVFKKDWGVEIDEISIFCIVILYRKENTGNSQEIKNLQQYCGVKSQIAFLQLGDSLMELQRLGIISLDNSRGEFQKYNKVLLDFAIIKDWLLAIVKNDSEISKKGLACAKMTEMHLIRKIGKNFYDNLERHSNNILYRSIMRNVTAILHSNKNLDIVTKLFDLYGIPSYGDESNDEMLTPVSNIFITIVILSKSFDDEGFGIDIQRIFEDSLGINLTMELTNQLENKTHPLITNEFVEIKPQNIREAFTIEIIANDSLFKHFLPDLETADSLKKSKFILLDKPQLVDSQKFYYPENVYTDLTLLEDIIKNNPIDNRLKLNIFIHGPSGSGKTSFVRQLAAKNRRILIQNKAYKSKWFGQSAENLEDMFDEVESLNNKMKEQPIFFVDESDSMLGNRNQGDSSIQETINELQCILLKRIENFPGILVLCSNFSMECFDSAFARRFHFVIEMNTTAEAKCNMLRDLLNQENIKYNDNEVLAIASNHKLSPALIKSSFQKKHFYAMAKRDFDIMVELKKHISKRESCSVGYFK
jgi:hypothetical protein